MLMDGSISPLANGIGRIPPMSLLRSWTISLARFWIVPHESDTFAASRANISAHLVNVTGSERINGST